MIKKTKTRRVLRLAQVIQKTTLKRDSIYRGGREGWFPRPIKLGDRESGRASGWFEDEIDDYLDLRGRERDAKVKTP